MLSLNFRSLSATHALQFLLLHSRLPPKCVCIFKFDVFGLCFDPSRFVLMDQINSAGDIADYGDFMLNRHWVKLYEILNRMRECWGRHHQVPTDSATHTHILSVSLFYTLWLIFRIIGWTRANVCVKSHESSRSLAWRSAFARRRPKNNFNFIQKYIIMMMAMMISAITIQCFISSAVHLLSQIQCPLTGYICFLCVFHFDKAFRCHHTSLWICLSLKSFRLFYFSHSFWFESTPPTLAVKLRDDDCSVFATVWNCKLRWWRLLNPLKCGWERQFRANLMAQIKCGKTFSSASVFVSITKFRLHQTDVD